MSKIKLTQSMRKDIMDKIIFYVRDQDPKYKKIIEDFDNLINCLIRHTEKTVYQEFNVSDEVYDFLKKNNMFEAKYYGYIYIYIITVYHGN